MPTFLVIKSTSVVDTIRGANPSALKAAVNKAVADSSRIPGKNPAVFQSKGYTLGSSTTPSRPVNQGFASALSGSGGLGDIIVRFFALYLVSLFSFDAYASAEQSPFNVRARR